MWTQKLYRTLCTNFMSTINYFLRYLVGKICYAPGIKFLYLYQRFCFVGQLEFLVIGDLLAKVLLLKCPVHKLLSTNSVVIWDQSLYFHSILVCIISSFSKLYCVQKLINSHKKNEIWIKTNVSNIWSIQSVDSLADSAKTNRADC